MNLINGFCLAAGILKGVQVLVVDNDRDSRDLYAFLLEDQSANVITAGSVKEALEILSWFTPNILVCEIRFLGESIYTLLNTLTAMEADNGNHIPIIVTSTSTTGTHDLIPNVEFEEYLLKPFDLDKFVSMIRNQVQGDVAEKFCPELLVLQKPTVLLSTSQSHNRVEFSSATCRNNTKE
ncbi:MULTISPECIES: response regulator [unclassified Nostoc]|uniref:response regulator n=1 Tax=unclassified Nostoc TaxID=2593658 RepID=UPI0013D6DE64|nr:MULTISPECIES: response regulator [unclassified Nostoc]MBE8997117.1 response regulator [Nostoc sp. LEGE 12447]NEU82294.1 response regulator [Nostoc sp. UIC 10630]